MRKGALTPPVAFASDRRIQMRIGYALLIAGATFLASQTAVLAQGVPPDAAPVGAAPSSAAAPGIQGSFNPPAPIRPGQAISVLVFPFGFAGGMEPGAAPAEPAAPTGEPGAAFPTKVDML